MPGKKSMGQIAMGYQGRHVWHGSSINGSPLSLGGLAWEVKTGVTYLTMESSILKKRNLQVTTMRPGIDTFRIPGNVLTYMYSYRSQTH